MTPARMLGNLVVMLLSANVFADPPTPPRPDLSGTVRAESEGMPIKDATVYIYTAGVRTGVSPYCPFCYPDCGKNTTTDASGHFVVESLDPELIFRVLVVAEGYEPKVITNVDPPKGQPADVTLKRFDPARLEPQHVARGRVVGHDGEPIRGAVVYRMSPDDLTDPLAATNDRGEFVLTSPRDDGTSFEVFVEARGFAPRIAWVQRGGPVREIALGEGVVLRGRLFNDGVPVSGAVIALMSVDGFQSLLHLSAGTNENGFFEIPSVPPDAEYFLYGTMNSLKDIGVVPARRVKLGGHDSETDVGDLRVVAGHRISGRVVLSDGEPLPTGVHLIVSRLDSGDSQVVGLDSHGRFDVRGVPKELIRLGVPVPGYFPSPKNRSRSLSEWSLEGMVDGDISDLIFLLDPGPGRQDGHLFTEADLQARHTRRLLGAAE